MKLKVDQTVPTLVSKAAFIGDFFKYSNFFEREDATSAGHELMHNLYFKSCLNTYLHIISPQGQIISKKVHNESFILV